MAILNNFLKPIADAIRSKKGTVLPINAQNFASEIESIEPPLESIELNQNGEYDVTDYKKAIVNCTSDDIENFYKPLISGQTMSNINIPYGISEIGDTFFTKTPQVRGDSSYTVNLTIPSSIKKIGLRPFLSSYFNTSAINRYNIYFTGKIEDWVSIEFASTDSIPWITAYFNGKHFYVLNSNNEYYEVTNLVVDSNNTLTKISNYCFCCFKLPLTMDISNSKITTIGKGSFQESYLKGSVIMPSTLVEIKEAAFKKTQITNIVLNEGLETIGNSAFSESLIETLIIPNSVTSLGESFCYSCSKLNKVVIPNGLTTLPLSSFQSCSNLTSLTIPSSITEISTRALQIGSSSNKATIVIKSETPSTITTTTFNKSYLNKIIVPKGTSATYKSATNWSTFADYIFEPNNIAINVDSSLLNNESVTYSIDNGEMEQFTSATFALENVSTLTIKNTSASTTIKVGTTAGGSEIGTVTNATITYTFDADTTIYISQS